MRAYLDHARLRIVLRRCFAFAAVVTMMALVFTALLGAPVAFDASTCTTHQGVQCMGDDIEDAGVVASAAACCTLCNSISGCKAWTFNQDYDQHCWVRMEASKPLQRLTGSVLQTTAAQAVRGFASK
jgi:hypothetical protein